MVVTTTVTSIVAVSADCDEVGFSRRAAAPQRNNVMDIISGLATLGAANADLTLLTVSLKDLFANVPPLGSRIAVAISYDS